MAGRSSKGDEKVESYEFVSPTETHLPEEILDLDGLTKYIQKKKKKAIKKRDSCGPSKKWREKVTYLENVEKLINDNKTLKSKLDQKEEDIKRLTDEHAKQLKLQTVKNNTQEIPVEDDSSEDGNKRAHPATNKEDPSQTLASLNPETPDYAPETLLQKSTTTPDESTQLKGQLEEDITELESRKRTPENDVRDSHLQKKELKEEVTEFEKQKGELKQDNITDFEEQRKEAEEEQKRKAKDKSDGLKEDFKKRYEKRESELKLEVKSLHLQKDDLQKKHDALQAENAALKVKLSENEKEAEESYEKRENELKLVVKSLHQQKDDLQKKHDALQAANAEDITELESRKRALENDVGDLQLQKKKLKKDVNELEKQSGVKQGITDLEGQRKEAEEEQKRKAKDKSESLKEDFKKSYEKRESELKLEVKSLHQQKDDLQKKHDALQAENAALKVKLLENAEDGAMEIETVPEPECHVVIPFSCRDDTRIQAVMKAWLSQLQEAGNIRLSYKDGKDITLADGIVLLSCVVTGNIQRDIEGTIRLSGLGPSVDLIVIVWHHKAQHVAFPRPTRDALAYSDLVKRCLLLSDAFFWDGTMYQCDRNNTSVHEVQEVVGRKRRDGNVMNRDGNVVMEAAQPSPNQQPRLTLVLPQSSKDDDRLNPLFPQLLDRLRNKGVDPHVTVKEGPSISHHDGIVILPCIAASRVGSDLSAALDKAKLGPTVRLIIVIFNCKAPHESRIPVPTRDRLSDRETVRRCILFADAVFWEKKMYNCKANDVLMDELVAVLSEK